MAQFEPHKAEIENLGADLVYIAAEKRQGWWKPEKYFSQHPISFPFLLDEDRSVTKAYGLYHPLASDAFRIARPATLIVDRGGLIQYVYCGANQIDRAPLQEAMAALKQIAAK
jgi:peroxiredoxin